MLCTYVNVSSQMTWHSTVAIRVVLRSLVPSPVSTSLCSVLANSERSILRHGTRYAIMDV